MRKYFEAGSVLRQVLGGVVSLLTVLLWLTLLYWVIWNLAGAWTDAVWAVLCFPIWWTGMLLGMVVYTDVSGTEEGL